MSTEPLLEIAKVAWYIYSAMTFVVQLIWIIYLTFRAHEAVQMADLMPQAFSISQPESQACDKLITVYKNLWYIICTHKHLHTETPTRNSRLVAWRRAYLMLLKYAEKQKN